MHRAALALCLALVAGPSSAQEAPFWPGANYDPAIPTVRQVLGHDPGAEITPPEQMGQYLQALQKAAPTRSRLFEYARSWEGRPLWLMVIGSPGAHRPSRRRSRRICRSSPTRAACRRPSRPAWYRAAGRRLAGSRRPRQRDLVGGRRPAGGLSPAGRAGRCRRRRRAARRPGADRPDAEPRWPGPLRVPEPARPRRRRRIPTPYNAEHDEPWPGGRSNHYLFDMNRDWFAQTQPETRGRIQVARDYWPHVNVDLHEQGGDNTYYFAPPADPLNPHITKSQIAAFDLFGRANGAALRRARLALFHPRGLRLVLSGLRRVVADLPGLDRHDLRAGLGARPVVRAERRHHAHLSRRRHAPLQRRHRHRDDRGEEPRAAGARLPRLPQERGGRGREGARCASTCSCPATTRPARRCWRKNLATQGIEVRRTTEPLKVGDRAVAGRRLPRLERAAVGPADPEPARSATSRSPTTSSSGRRNGARGGRPIRSTTSPRGACRCSTTWRCVTSATAITAKHDDAADRLRRAARGAADWRRRRSATWCPGDPLPRRCRRRACAGHPHAQRRRRLRAERPPLSDRHGASSATPAIRPTCTRGWRRWPRSTARRSCRSTPRSWTRASRSAATRRAS